MSTQRSAEARTRSSQTPTAVPEERKPAAREKPKKKPEKRSAKKRPTKERSGKRVAQAGPARQADIVAALVSHDRLPVQALGFALPQPTAAESAPAFGLRAPHFVLLLAAIPMLLLVALSLAPSFLRSHAPLALADRRSGLASTALALVVLLLLVLSLQT